MAALARWVAFRVMTCLCHISLSLCWRLNRSRIRYRVSFLYDLWKILWLFFWWIVCFALCGLFVFIWILQRLFRFVLLRFSCLLPFRHIRFSCLLPFRHMRYQGSWGFAVSQWRSGYCDIFLVYAYLVVLQGALGDDLEIVSIVCFILFAQFFSCVG